MIVSVPIRIPKEVCSHGLHSRFLLFFAVIFSVVLVFLVGWVLTYPSESDPKNIRYVCWKAGFHAMDPDIALGTMIGDADRERIVIGRTKEELRSKFGYLLPPAGAPPYLRGCYNDSSWRGKDVLFIRSSPWMVVFAENKATDLILIKGC
jgi:hypothetical protein